MAAPVAVATTAVAPAQARPCKSDADDLLERAMTLHDLITKLGDKSSSSPIPTILQKVREDLVKYGQIASGRVPPGANAAGGTFVAQGQGTAPTRDQVQQMQDAAWMQSGATQAEMIIRQFLYRLSSSPITTDAQDVYGDIRGDSAGLHLDKVIGDLQTFLKDIEAVVAPINELVGYREPDGSVPGPKTGAGALRLYLGPVLEAVDDARSSVKASLDPSAIPRLQNELTSLSQGHDLAGKDGNPGTCVERRDTIGH